MPARSASLTTLIGLPIFLVVALGLAFGASFISRTLRQDPTLHADANRSATNQVSDEQDTTFDRYDDAVATLATIVYERMIQSAALTNTSANPASATNAATVLLAGICWLSTNPGDLQFFPAGNVTRDFNALIQQYASLADPQPVCSSITETAQTQASRLMTLDDDGDGLNTIAEYWYDTNQFSNDTDRDGFRDDEEIANGFNPLGAGQPSSQ